MSLFLRLPKRALRLLSSPSFFLLRKPMIAVCVSRLRSKDQVDYDCAAAEQRVWGRLAVDHLCSNTNFCGENQCFWWTCRGQSLLFERRRRVTECLKGGGVS